jgi:deoxyribonuclease V
VIVFTRVCQYLNAMLCCVDVDYQPSGVTAACVGFTSWADPLAAIEVVVRSFEAPQPYEPGQFAKRELPFLQAVLARMPAVDAILVDAYVWLGTDRPGMGKVLHDACGTPVIGVAKTRFEGAAALEVVRGDSQRPLYVTAVGFDAAVAAEHVRTMHGEFRIPTLIKRADTLARGNR